MGLSIIIYYIIIKPGSHSGYAVFIYSVALKPGQVFDKKYAIRSHSEGGCGETVRFKDVRSDNGQADYLFSRFLRDPAKGGGYFITFIFRIINMVSADIVAGCGYTSIRQKYFLYYFSFLLKGF